MSIREHLTRQLLIRDWRAWTFVALMLGHLWLPGFFGVAADRIWGILFIALLAIVFLPFAFRMEPSCPSCGTKWKVRIGRRSLVGPEEQRVRHCPYCAANLDESVAIVAANVVKSPSAKGTIIRCSTVLATFVAGAVALEVYIKRNYQPAADNPADSIVVYSTEWCGSCKQLKQCLANNNVPFTEKDIELSTQALHEHRSLGAKGVPATLVGDKLVHGFDRDKISTLLKGIGYEVRC